MDSGRSCVDGFDVFTLKGIPVDLHRLSHGPQLINFPQNAAVFDGHPLGQFHAGQAGGVFDG
jgi:hypothetical protein